MSSKSGIRRWYRRNKTGMVRVSRVFPSPSSRPGAAARPRPARPALRGSRGRRNCRGPRSRPPGVLRRWPACAMRRSASSRGMPRCSSRSRRSGFGVSTTITASYWRPRLDSTSRGTSWTTMPSAGAAATCRRNSSPIAGCVIASRSCFASSVPNARSASAARSSDPSGCRISAPNRSTSLLERGRARFHDLPRDEIRVDDHRAARDEQLRPPSTSPTRSRPSAPPSTPRGD